MIAEPDGGLDDLARIVVDAAFAVHRELGPGFLEAVYEEALCVELHTRQIPFTRQAPVAVTYEGYVVGEGRIDLLVDRRWLLATLNLGYRPGGGGGEGELS